MLAINLFCPLTSCVCAKPIKSFGIEAISSQSDKVGKGGIGKNKPKNY